MRLPRGAYRASHGRRAPSFMRTSRAPSTSSTADSQLAAASPWSMPSQWSSHTRTRVGGPSRTTGTSSAFAPGKRSRSGASADDGSSGSTSASFGARRCDKKEPRASTAIHSRS